MPTYFFRDTDTGEEWCDEMKISECTLFLQENPTIETFPGMAGTPDAPGISTGLHSGMGLGFRKIDDGFNDVLKRIKKGSGRRNSINTK